MAAWLPRRVSIVSAVFRRLISLLVSGPWPDLTGTASRQVPKPAKIPLTSTLVDVSQVRSGGDPADVSSGDPTDVPGGGPADVAPVGRRFGALVVDWIMCLLVGGAFGGVFSTATARPWLPVLVLVVDYALFLGFFGQTPGMRLTRIRCVSVTDGGVIGLPRALLRGLLLALVVPALIMDSYGRGLHDRAAGSIMLAVP
jgi:hypothetical protein